jgi:hypothetical protein
MADTAAEEKCFASLPTALAHLVFALLPVDQRMRCAEVCPSWRVMLQERSLWLRLDLSEASGGLARPATNALLRAAAARAAGQLQSINVAECRGITHACLLAVLTANAGALRELRACRGNLVGMAAAEELLRAAPQLRVFDADMDCESVADAQRLLRNEGAFAPLRLRKIQVTFAYSAQTEATVLSLAEDLASHTSLVDVFLAGAPLDTPAALDAIVAVALANRFSALALANCRLSPASAPALARLLGGDVLRMLYITNDEVPLLDAAAAAVLRDALRTNSTLAMLLLLDTMLWHDPAGAVTLLGSVTAHRSLRYLDLTNNPIGDAQHAAGAALGALVTGDAPALLYLDLSGCGLQEAALGPLVDALPANTHLHTLRLGGVTARTEFFRERLLPAVRASTSLMDLKITVTGEGESDAL